MSKWFNAKREKASKVGTIRIFDQIGENWFGEGTTAKAFVAAVDDLGDDLETLNVHINSPGGNVYDGLAIYNYLSRHSAEVVVYIDGIAASIASIIAMAGNKIVMPENATMFIHNPWTFAGGDAAALRKTAEELDTLRGSLLGVYMRRSSLEENDVIGMMDAETLLTAEEAVEWGFADEIEGASQMAADIGSPAAFMAIAKIEAQHELAVVALKAQVSQLESALTEQTELATTEAARAEAALAPPTPMDSVAVIKLATENKAPEWLATRLIQEEAPEETVLGALDDYSGVLDACTAAGIEEAADAICREHWNDMPSLIAALLTDGLASLDEETANRRKVDGEHDGQGSTFDHKSVYAKRNNQSATPRSHK